MKLIKYLRLILFSLIFYGLFSSFCFAQQSPCLTCHSDLKAPGKSIHIPLNMGCDACHVAVEGKTHPVEKKSIKLSQAMPQLCFECHMSSKFQDQFIHAPVSNGMCLGCHNPHSSPHENLLRDSSPEICYICHDKSAFTKKNVHKVINVIGCLACHKPHAGEYTSLLPSSINEVCITCHKQQGTGRHVVNLPGKKFHPLKGVIDTSTLKYIKVQDPKNPKKWVEIPDPNVPGKELSCASCHNPHSSDYEHLFPTERVCLGCHKY